MPLPKLNEAAASGFAWGRVPKEEGEAPRQIKLRAHIEAGLEKRAYMEEGRTGRTWNRRM